jgi:hypothetical protein
VDITNLSTDIVAVGALGTAAFGLVDSFKALPGGGISRFGFKHIRTVIVTLTPPVASLEKTALGRDPILQTLLSQWINGVDKSNQISIAKSLIKLRLTPETAPALAAATGVDGDILTRVATKIKNGTAASSSQAPDALTTQESDIYGRFDLLLNMLLDQAYQRADQRYRNVAKVAAIPVALGLALVAAAFINWTKYWAPAVLIGLVSTPIAPIAKDISSAITTAAQAIQFGKK